MFPHRPLAASLVAAVLFVAAPGAQDRVVTPPIRGFSPDGSLTQRATERRLRELPRAESIKAWHRYFTAQPHPATSVRTREIANVRYSNPYSYRGFKALTAEREGAAAMIVYSDPQQDGYVKGEAFPKGPWGPASHLRRGGAHALADRHAHRRAAELRC